MGLNIATRYVLARRVMLLMAVAASAGGAFFASQGLWRESALCFAVATLLMNAKDLLP